VLSSSIKDFRNIASVPYKHGELFGNCSLHFINCKATFSFLTQVRIIFHPGKNHFLPGWKTFFTIVENENANGLHEKCLIATSKIN